MNAHKTRARRRRRRPDENPLKLYSVDETCELLGIVRSTLYRLINSRELAVTRVAGRTMFSADSIKTFTERCTEAA